MESLSSLPGDIRGVLMPHLFLMNGLGLQKKVTTTFNKDLGWCILSPHSLNVQKRALRISRSGSSAPNRTWELEPNSKPSAKQLTCLILLGTTYFDIVEWLSLFEL